MKSHKFVLGCLAFTCFVSSAFAVREINMHVEVVNGVTHWMPEKIEVKRGEKVKFIVVHDVPEGFALHGFSIPVLKIAKQVDRQIRDKEDTKKVVKDNTLKVDAEVPASLTPGEYDIGCQFHPKHAGAKLVVK